MQASRVSGEPFIASPKWSRKKFILPCTATKILCTTSSLGERIINFYRLSLQENRSGRRSTVLLKAARCLKTSACLFCKQHFKPGHPLAGSSSKERQHHEHAAGIGF